MQYVYPPTMHSPQLKAELNITLVEEARAAVKGSKGSRNLAVVKHILHKSAAKDIEGLSWSIMLIT